MAEVMIGSKYEETVSLSIEEVVALIEHEALAAFEAAQAEGWVPQEARIAVRYEPSLLGHRIDINVYASAMWVQEIDLFGDGVQTADAKRLHELLAAIRDQYQRDASNPAQGNYDRRFHGGVAIWTANPRPRTAPPVSTARQAGHTHDTQARAAMIAVVATSNTLRLMQAHAHGVAALVHATDPEHTAINFMLTLIEGALIDRGVPVCAECGLLRGTHSEECPDR